MELNVGFAQDNFVMVKVNANVVPISKTPQFKSAFGRSWDKVGRTQFVQPVKKEKIDVYELDVWADTKVAKRAYFQHEGRWYAFKVSDYKTALAAITSTTPS